MEPLSALLKGRLCSVRILEGLLLTNSKCYSIELSTAFAKAKREEKLRGMQESEMVRVLFGFNAATSTDRVAFETASKEAMELLEREYVLTHGSRESVGAYCDIVNEFLAFHRFTGDIDRVNEIQLITNHTNFMNYHFLGFLYKGLITIAKRLLSQTMQKATMMLSRQQQQQPQMKVAVSHQTMNDAASQQLISDKNIQELTEKLFLQSSKQAAAAAAADPSTSCTNAGSSPVIIISEFVEERSGGDNLQSNRQRRESQPQSTTSLSRLVDETQADTADESLLQLPRSLAASAVSSPSQSTRSKTLHPPCMSSSSSAAATKQTSQIENFLRYVAATTKSVAAVPSTTTPRKRSSSCASRYSQEALTRNHLLALNAKKLTSFKGQLREVICSGGSGDELLFITYPRKTEASSPFILKALLTRNALVAKTIDDYLEACHASQSIQLRLQQARDEGRKQQQTAFARKNASYSITSHPPPPRLTQKITTATVTPIRLHPPAPPPPIVIPFPLKSPSIQPSFPLSPCKHNESLRGLRQSPTRSLAASRLKQHQLSTNTSSLNVPSQEAIVRGNTHLLRAAVSVDTANLRGNRSRQYRRRPDSFLPSLVNSNLQPSSQLQFYEDLSSLKDQLHHQKTEGMNDADASSNMSIVMMQFNSFKQKQQQLLVKNQQKHLLPFTDQTDDDHRQSLVTHDDRQGHTSNDQSTASKATSPTIKHRKQSSSIRVLKELLKVQLNSLSLVNSISVPPQSSEDAPDSPVTNSIAACTPKKLDYFSRESSSCCQRKNTFPRIDRWKCASLLHGSLQSDSDLGRPPHNSLQRTSPPPLLTDLLPINSCDPAAVANKELNIDIAIINHSQYRVVRKNPTRLLRPIDLKKSSPQITSTSTLV